MNPWTVPSANLTRIAAVADPWILQHFNVILPLSRISLCQIDFTASLKTVSDVFGANYFEILSVVWVITHLFCFQLVLKPCGRRAGKH